MTQRWSVQGDCLELQEMPFYWRLSESPTEVPGIPAHLPFRVTPNEDLDYLEYRPTDAEWDAITLAYRQNETIGFVNPQSGQIDTYGSSVNQFFHEVVAGASPSRIYEIGCGAGFTIQFLKERGWSVTGIDPSDYSLQWSERLGFSLIQAFFAGGLLTDADLILCNDVFEHVRNVAQFSRDVWTSLRPGGTFCFSTTNSTQSIAIGDVSMFEHQHVNMFTARSIQLLLAAAGFSDIEVRAGSYGNTFQVVARKATARALAELPAATCGSFAERAAERLRDFEKFYAAVSDRCQFYVPLRCIPYLAAVGDFGASDLYDSNAAWRGKLIDGYTRRLKSVADLATARGEIFFVGSRTFHDQIKRTLLDHGFLATNIFSITDLEYS